MSSFVVIVLVPLNQIVCSMSILSPEKPIFKLLTYRNFLEVCVIMLIWRANKTDLLNPLLFSQ